MSVVIPSYNHRGFVLDAIDSVLDQTLDDLELLVIDDASPDGSADAIAEHLADRADSRATLTVVEHAGLIANLNAGLARASGRYFAYLGSDDLWEPSKLERQVEAMATTGAAAAFSDCWVINEHGERTDRMGRIRPYAGGRIFDDLWIGRFQPPSPTNVFDRQTLLDVGSFDPAIQLEDRDLWLRVALDHPVAYVDEPLASYRVHGTNTSVTNRDMMAEAEWHTFHKIVALRPELGRDRGRMEARLLTTEAQLAWERRERVTALRLCAKALRSDHRHRPARRLLIRTLIPTP